MNTPKSLETSVTVKKHVNSAALVITTSVLLWAAIGSAQFVYVPDGGGQTAPSYVTGSQNGVGWTYSSEASYSISTDNDSMDISGYAEANADIYTAHSRNAGAVGDATAAAWVQGYWQWQGTNQAPALDVNLSMNVSGSIHSGVSLVVYGSGYWDGRANSESYAIATTDDWPSGSSYNDGGMDLSANSRGTNVNAWATYTADQSESMYFFNSHAPEAGYDAYAWLTGTYGISVTDSYRLAPGTAWVYGYLDTGCYAYTALVNEVPGDGEINEGRVSAGADASANISLGITPL